MTGSNGERDLRDDDLRTRFAALRREEEARAPEFALPSPGLAAHGRQWSSGKRIAIALCLVTIAATVFLRWVVPPASKRNGNPVASLTEWRAPTDFLLETPGRELLQTVPKIGVWRDYAKPSGPRQKHPPVRKQIFP